MLYYFSIFGGESSISNGSAIMILYYVDSQPGSPLRDNYVEIYLASVDYMIMLKKKTYNKLSEDVGLSFEA